MNFRELKLLLDVSVGRNDLKGLYDQWIARALKAIQVNHSYYFMRSLAEVTIPNASTSARLPEDFKELTHRRPAINVVSPDQNVRRIIVDISDRASLMQLKSSYILPTSQFYVNLSVFLEGVIDGWTVNTLDPVMEDFVLSVSYIRFLPDLYEDDDTNLLLIDFPEMVASKCRAVAFGDIEDPRAEVWEAKYELERQKAISADVRRKLSGQRNQMGG